MLLLLVWLMAVVMVNGELPVTEIPEQSICHRIKSGDEGLLYIGVIRDRFLMITESLYVYDLARTDALSVNEQSSFSLKHDPIPMWQKWPELYHRLAGRLKSEDYHMTFTVIGPRPIDDIFCMDYVYDHRKSLCMNLANKIAIDSPGIVDENWLKYWHTSISTIEPLTLYMMASDSKQTLIHHYQGEPPRNIVSGNGSSPQEITLIAKPKMSHRHNWLCFNPFMGLIYLQLDQPCNEPYQWFGRERRAFSDGTNIYIFNHLAVHIFPMEILRSSRTGLDQAFTVTKFLRRNFFRCPGESLDSDLLIWITIYGILMMLTCLWILCIGWMYYRCRYRLNLDHLNSGHHGHSRRHQHRTPPGFFLFSKVPSINDNNFLIEPNISIEEPIRRRNNTVSVVYRSRISQFNGDLESSSAGPRSLRATEALNCERRRDYQEGVLPEIRLSDDDDDDEPPPPPVSSRLPSKTPTSNES